VLTFPCRDAAAVPGVARPLDEADALLAGPDPDERKSAVTMPPAFVLPPIRLDDLMRDHIGMNDRQTNMAWRGVIRDREALRRFSRLMDRQHVLSREIEAALYEMRDVLLRAMWQKYPAATRRLRGNGLNRRDENERKSAGRRGRGDHMRARSKGSIQRGSAQADSPDSAGQPPSSLRHGGAVAGGRR
jgi:hypothetical protein